MIRADDDAETIANTVGVAMPGIEIRCVDDHGHDVATDTVGEILVRGKAVMRGYLDNPQATAEAIDSEGWLHTGDLGTLDARGYLRITDRKKDMYISGGFNCYPAEIESLLCAHPKIAAAAVVGIPDERMGEVGKAYLILRAGEHATSEEITIWSRQNMANYKVPRAIVFCEELPRNASGKVLKAELRQSSA